MKFLLLCLISFNVMSTELKDQNLPHPDNFTSSEQIYFYGINKLTGSSWEKDSLILKNRELSKKSTPTKSKIK